MEESLNVKKLADHIVTTIISIYPLPPHSNAFYEILLLVAPVTESLSPEKPPKYLKACKLLFHDEANKIVACEIVAMKKTMLEWPIVINPLSVSVALI